jgi:hypothetical protein
LCFFQADNKGPKNAKKNKRGSLVVDLGSVFEGEDDEVGGENETSGENASKKKKKPARQTLNPMSQLHGAKEERSPSRTSKPPPAQRTSQMNNPMVGAGATAEDDKPKEPTKEPTEPSQEPPKRKMSAAMSARLSAFGS